MSFELVSTALDCMDRLSIDTSSPEDQSHSVLRLHHTIRRLEYPLGLLLGSDDHELYDIIEPIVTRLIQDSNALMDVPIEHVNSATYDLDVSLGAICDIARHCSLRA